MSSGEDIDDADSGGGGDEQQQQRRVEVYFAEYDSWRPATVLGQDEDGLVVVQCVVVTSHFGGSTCVLDVCLLRVCVLRQFMLSACVFCATVLGACVRVSWVPARVLVALPLLAFDGCCSTKPR